MAQLIRKKARGAAPDTSAPAEALPAIEKRTCEFGFTTQPSRAPRIRAAARIYGTKVATYIREVIEADANRRCADWEREHGRPAA